MTIELGWVLIRTRDGVLNPSGVRFGSAEIYEIVEKIPGSGIMDTICVGQRRPHDTDESVVLFIKMEPGKHLTNSLRERIRKAIKEGRSARHVPKYMFRVKEIPYTINGNKIEIAVKQIISGKKVRPSGTVANPQCFASYKRFYDIEKADCEKDQMIRL
jgi:acetoacetyl-CoA synthetase